MATSKDFLEFVIGQLSELDGITYRQMMGEYIIYYGGKIAAYLCDNVLYPVPQPISNTVVYDTNLSAIHE